MCREFNMRNKQVSAVEEVDLVDVVLHSYVISHLQTVVLTANGSQVPTYAEHALSQLGTSSLKRFSPIKADD